MSWYFKSAQAFLRAPLREGVPALIDQSSNVWPAPRAVANMKRSVQQLVGSGWILVVITNNKINITVNQPANTGQIKIIQELITESGKKAERQEIIVRTVSSPFVPRNTQEMLEGLTGQLPQGVQVVA